MILYVAFGGAIGSVLRYLVGKLFTGVFPFGTLVVNIVGSLLIGLFYGLFEKYGTISQEVKVMLTVGICGGFTTFSTLMNDCYKMISLVDYINVAIYLCISIIFGFIAVYFGHRLAEYI